MKYKTLVRAGMRRHKGSLSGIFILMLLVSFVLITVLMVWSNSKTYVHSELDRMRFGDLTAWVSEVPDMEHVEEELQELEIIEQIETQEMIYTSYELNGEESDSEGQMIPYEPDEGRYRFFDAALDGYLETAPVIRPGEVYVPASFVSMFGAGISDELLLRIAREGGGLALRIAGFYEDPAMGSSMIGMKGFLVNVGDYENAEMQIGESGINALARPGAMFHIDTQEQVSAAEVNTQINQKTSLSEYTEFIYSRETMEGFMMILQNALGGILLAFAIILLIAVMVVIAHSINSTIASDYVDLGILKTMGVSSQMLERVQLIQYLVAVTAGMLAGSIIAAFAGSRVCQATLTTIGILIPSDFPVTEGFGAVLLVILLLTVFILRKVSKIGKIAPLEAIQGRMDPDRKIRKKRHVIRKKHIYLNLAVRQTVSGKRRYAGICMIAILLVFFASVVGRMDSWLGQDGKGMMDAFNPADHDIGIQAFGNVRVEDMREQMEEITPITDTYLLAMPAVHLNGASCTANVTDQPERFHLLSGRTCTADNEIVITEFMAQDQQAEIGDMVSVGGDAGEAEYVITGIYQCANEMGANLGMSREGYQKIGRDEPRIWCYHFFLEEPEKKGEVKELLEGRYGGDVHIHENTWPGLFGIIRVMRIALLVMYVMAALFILVTTVMTGSRILATEQKDLGIYKSVGFSAGRLRRSFAMRFMVVSFIGAAAGIVLAFAATDPLVGAVMKLAGISNFASHPDIRAMLFPGIFVAVLFTGFSWILSGKIKRMDMTVLISE